MIIDAHAHIFPPLAEACGFVSESEHRQFMQLYIGLHGEPVRRLGDHLPMPEAAAALNDGRIEGPEGLPKDADFRVGRFGRFEWDWKGDTYYRSFLPPSLQEMVSSPEFMLQQMARAGVDRAVLQNARPYGRLNAMFADAAGRYPDKFIGLADVVEHAAHTPEESDRLTRAVRDFGMRGVYFANRGLLLDRYEHGFDDAQYGPYWETVQSLGIPVFWEIQGVPLPTPDAFLQEIERLNRWCERYPEVRSVLTHGLAPDYLEGDVPQPIAELCRREQVMVEILYPIHWGRLHDYPYPELRPILNRLIDLVGPSRLIWGSDMPNVERNCTYKQSLDYLPKVLAGLVDATELDGILGGNVLGLLE